MSVVKSDPIRPSPGGTFEVADFPRWPAGWIRLAASNELTHDRPISRELFGRPVVAYRTRAGKAVAMDARCWHMGANLAGGEIVGDCVQCPFHGWRFDASGVCTRVPSQPDLPPPDRVRQANYAVAETGGVAFVFPSSRPTHALPFFDGVSPDELVAAAPFEFRIGCPWWLVGTNGFDLQHFLAAHDRRLVGRPAVSEPHPSARRIVAIFEVVGEGWRDRLTRRFSGPFVTMDVTVWAGSLAFVKAMFAPTSEGPSRTTSFGRVEILPDHSAGPHSSASVVRITIFVRRRRPMLDRIDAGVRRRFIRAFLQPDVRLLDGARLRPDRLIDADVVMADYLAWLASASRLPLISEQDHS